MDYGKLYETRYDLLRLAYSRFEPGQMADFLAESAWWLPDYALFMALKRLFDMRPWNQWPADIRAREADALAHYRALLKDEIELEYFIQFCFFRQFAALKAFCREKGVGLIGDLPIYVAPDSADVMGQRRGIFIGRRFPAR